MLAEERISAPVAPLQRSTSQAVAATPAAAPLFAGPLTPSAVLLLQRSAGNAAVAALLRRGRTGGDGHACTCSEKAADGEMCESCRRTRLLRQAVERGSLQRQELPQEAGESQEGEEEEPVSLGTISIPQAEPVKVVVFAPGPTLKGETTAHYSSDDPTLVPNPPKASKAKGCKECGNESCIRAQGTMVVNYASNPTVELPDLDGYGFTDCQRKNAEKFVRNVLSPHEQEHVRTFIKHFDGTVKTPFDLKVCSTDDAAAKIDALYRTQIEARRAKAQAASDALDAGGKNQFSWDMDEGCKKDEDKAE